MAQHNELGIKGEEAATVFLKDKGYRILERNWRKNRHEIDIVVENEEFVVFVEVKTRTTREWGDPEDFINSVKIRRIVEAADLYLKYTNNDKPARFDIIAVVWDGVVFEVEHIDDAFMSPVF